MKIIDKILTRQAEPFMLEENKARADGLNGFPFACAVARAAINSGIVVDLTIEGLLDLAPSEVLEIQNKVLEKITGAFHIDPHSFGGGDSGGGQGVASA